MFDLISPSRGELKAANVRTYVIASKKELAKVKKSHHPPYKMRLPLRILFGLVVVAAVNVHGQPSEASIEVTSGGDVVVSVGDSSLDYARAFYFCYVVCWLCNRLHAQVATIGCAFDHGLSESSEFMPAHAS